MEDMTSQQFIERFIQILENEYGKLLGSDITVARAVEVIKLVFEERE